LQTVVVAAITSNLRLGALPGNLRIGRGEANLPRACVVNVTQLVTIDKARLIERVGRLSTARREEIAEGLSLLLGADSILQ
jgi:mRNA interferase MazF